MLWGAGNFDAHRSGQEFVDYSEGETAPKETSYLHFPMCAGHLSSIIDQSVNFLYIICKFILEQHPGGILSRGFSAGLRCCWHINKL